MDQGFAQRNANACRTRRFGIIEGVLSVPRKQSAFLASLFFAISPVFAGSNASQLPDGPGKATVQKICSGCHPPEIVLGHRDTKDGWTQIVTDMVNKGANGTDDEFNTIIDYLAVHFPKKVDEKATGSDSTAKSR